MGTIKVQEFNQDDDDIEIDVTCEKPSDFVAGIKKVLKTQIKSDIQKVINDLKEELKRIDANEEKIRNDKLEREAAEKEMKEAQENSGNIKNQIFEEQKKKEEELKKKT
jgi:RNase H-fold protein (predicted Holliday junction resolvase)